MSKVIKILVSLLSYLILGAIMFIIALTLLLQINMVQNYIVDKATGIISDKLETTVSIGRIDLQLNRGLVVEDIYIEDYQKDTLIHAGNISVSLRVVDLIGGELSLGDVSLSDVKFNLIQRKIGESNLKQILMRLKGSPKSKKNSFKMKVKGLEVNNLHFIYKKLNAPRRDYGVNFGDIEVTNLRLNTQDISIIDDSITLKINNLALHEKSGFNVNSLRSLGFNISSKGIRFDELTLKSGESNLKLPYLELISEGWESYSDFLNKVVLEGKAIDSKVSFSTIAYFAPTLKRWESVLDDVNVSLYGTVSNLSGRVDNVSLLETDVKAKYRITGIPDIKNTHFTLDIEALQTSAKDAKFIMEDITGKPFTALDKFQSKLDYLSLKGRFAGELTNFTSDLELSTKYGFIGLSAVLAPDTDSNYRVESTINMPRFNLGKFLNHRSLGLMALTTTLKGSISTPNEIKIETDARIISLEYNKYNYNNIDMVGTWHDHMFVGELSSYDPNLDFSFDGKLDFSSDIPKYDFDLDLRNADLSRLNFNKLDSVSLIEGKIVANASGTNLDNINGNIEVSDLQYINNIDTIRSENIILVGENSETSKHIALNSTYADIEFRSKTSYRELFDYVKAVLNTYLPTLKDKSVDNFTKIIGDDAADLDNYSLLKVNIKETNNLSSVLIPGLYVSQGTNASLLLNSEARTVSIFVKSDYIEYNNYMVSDFDVNIRNQGDSLMLYAGAKELYAGGMYMPNFSVLGGAKNNAVSLATKFNNTENGRSVLIGVKSFVERNSETNVPQLRIKFTPSYLRDKKQTWSIFSNDIVYDTTGVSIGDFRVVNRDQKLVFSGVASRSNSDTLKVSLSKFDISPFSQLTERLGYKVNGSISGEAYMQSALKNGVVDAAILLDSLTLNDISLPTVRFNSTWDSKRDRINVDLVREDNKDSVITGYYRPKGKLYSAKVAMNGVAISILDPLLKGVIGGTEGEANLDVLVSNVGGKMSMDGGITISKFSTAIDFLNVRYGIDTAHISVKNSVLKLANTRVYDPKGNSGDFGLNLDLRNFANINYDLKILPENLMVLNTNMKQNSLFYGSVYASGAAMISGDKGGVNMDIRATTAGNSKFFLPLSGKSNASTANFIVFEEANKAEPTEERNTLYRKRLMLGKGKKSKVGNAPNMNINLALNVLPNTELQVVIDPTVGDAIKATGNGVLNLNINPSKNIFSMIGDYEIVSGSYMFTLQNIINKKFTIDPGSSIKWTGDPVNALLDITAIYKLKTSLTPLDREMKGVVPVECKIFLKDRLSQPSVTFGVTIPNADTEVQSLISHLLNTQEMVSTQFFWLLAVNSFDTDRASIGAEAGSATGFEFLSSQISNWISSDKFNIGIRYKPKGEMTSDEVNVDFSTQLFSNRLLLELEGNYDSGNNPSMSESGSDNPIRGDVYLTWIIDKSDNLRAKAFSRTIDSYDEDDGLQENGVGVYYKANFNVFRDVIDSVKEYFSYSERKKRERIRVEKRSARRKKNRQ